jgi:hypothetical protein
MSTHQKPSQHVLAAAARLVENGHDVLLSHRGDMTVFLSEHYGEKLRQAAHGMSFEEIETSMMDVPETIHAILVKKLYPERA